MTLVRRRRPRNVVAQDAQTEVLDEPLVDGRVTREYYEEVEQPRVPPPPPDDVRRVWRDELGWALLALLVLVLGGLAGWWYFSHRGEPKRTVPVVTGISVARAVDVLQARGLRARIVTVAHGGSPGFVFRESPAAGSRVTKGTAVQIAVPGAPTTVTVPNAVGLPEAAARDRLVAAGFTVTESRVFDDGRVGTVTAQSPAAGGKAAKGGTVRINVSKGSAEVIVPNVVGQSVGAAETLLARAGLKAVVQLRVPSAQPAGIVVAQDPAGGQARRGSTVKLNASTGTGASGGATGATGATGAG